VGLNWTHEVVECKFDGIRW